MILYYDLDKKELVQAPGIYGAVRSYNFMRGDYTPLELHVLSGNVEVTDITDIVAIIKAEPGENSEVLAMADEWTQPEGEDYFIGQLNLNGASLNTLLGSLRFRSLLFQICCHRAAIGPISSQLVVANVGGDLYRGDEGSPAELPDPDDDWVAHGHAQTLTPEQKARARENIDAGEPYAHPATHPPSIIGQDATNRFVTDAEKTAWNAKAAGTHTHKKIVDAAESTAVDGETRSLKNAEGTTVADWSRTQTGAKGFLWIPAGMDKGIAIGNGNATLNDGGKGAGHGVLHADLEARVQAVAGGKATMGIGEADDIKVDDTNVTLAKPLILGTALAISQGGTGASTAAAARTALGVMPAGAALPGSISKTDRLTPAFGVVAGAIKTAQAINIFLPSGAVAMIAAGADALLDTGSFVAGFDYAIHATTAGGLLSSASFTPPAGGVLIGGFHYALGGNATVFAATASNNGGDSTPQINPYSIWDLNFRPACSDPRGMALIAGKFWMDIYLCNADHHLYGTSSAGKTIADGAGGTSLPMIPTTFGGNGSTRYGNCDGFTSGEVLAAYGKSLPTLNDCHAAFVGVKEGTSIGSDPVTTKLDALRTSKWGIMQATGNMWHWTLDAMWRGDRDGALATFTANTTNTSTTISAVTPATGVVIYPGMAINGNGIPAGTQIVSYDSGASTAVISKAATATASAVTVSAWVVSDIYGAVTNPWRWISTGSRGQQMTNSPQLVRALSGGRWNDGGNAGSRSANWSYTATSSNYFVGFRGRSDLLIA